MLQVTLHCKLVLPGVREPKCDCWWCLQTGILGQGTFGTVIRATDPETDPPVDVAIKLLPRGNFIKNFKTYVKREILNQSSLRHPFIVSLREVTFLLDFLMLRYVSAYVRNDCKRAMLLAAYIMRCGWCAQVFLTPTHLAIAMEFAQGGDLFRYVLRHQPICRLSEAKAKWIFQQLIIGLDYCHQRVSMLWSTKPCLHLLLLQLSSPRCLRSSSQPTN